MFFGQQPDGEEHQQPKEDEGPSLYQIIGLPKQASTNQIIKHFRRRAVKQHPDKGGDPQKYRQLSEAYEILKDPEKRDLYDKYGMQGVKAGGDPNGGGDFFSSFFGGSGQQDKGPKKCKPKLVKVNITLAQAYHGGSKEQTVTRMRVCDKCQGKGGQNAKQCPGCKGARYKQKLVQLGPGMFTKTAAPCDDCHAQGTIFQQKDRCANCKGQRIIQSTKTFQVTIEPGVPHQNDTIYTGQADELPGTLAGDLYFRIFIESHSQFKRKGADLYITKKISLLQSLTGVTFQIILLDNNKIVCSTAPGEIISNYQRKIIKHQGMPFFKSSMSKGHLIVTFQIQYPQPGEINDKDYAKLAQILGQKPNITIDNTNNQNRKVFEHFEEPKSHHQVHQQQQHQDDEDDGQGQGGVQCQSQ